MRKKKNDGGRGKEKKERNLEIFNLINSGWTHEEVCEEYGFSSKGTVSGIYKRLKDRAELSTGK